MEEKSLQLGREQQEALVQSVSMMNEVAKRIKQIPELPSEKPIDNHPLLRVEMPDEGEVFTYMEGYDYPYRGYPYYEFVDKIDLIKKLSRNAQSGFYHGLKNLKWKWLLIPLIPSLGQSLFWSFTYTFYRLIDRFKMRTNRYSQFVQELHRAFSVSWNDESERISELRKMLRDIECMILEFDNAYRFRAQDLIPEINKHNLRKNPVKEINRLLDIWIEREVKEEVKDSWRLLKLFTSYYLRFDKELLNLFVRVLLELDIEKCRLTTEDKYFSVPRKDYNFAFMANPTDEDKKIIKKVRLYQKYDEDRNAIRSQSTIEHQILNELHKKEGVNHNHENEVKALDLKFDKQLLQVEQKYLEDKAKI